MKILNALTFSTLFTAFFPIVGLAADTVAASRLTADATAPQLAWPQFRGRGGSGVADAEHPPVEIGPDKNLKWKVSVPSGLSSPIVVGDKLVITAFDEGKLYTLAFNRADGSQLWRAQAAASTIEPYHKTEGSPASSTPATDGQRIVSYFGSCGLVCYDLSGKELWKFELPPVALFGGFGSGVSPIIAHGTVILVRDNGNDSKIFALDAATGSLKWEQKRQSPVSYATPVAWDTAAGNQIAVAGHARMIGYDLASGHEKWSVAGIPSACCASPVTFDGNLLFAGWSPGGADDVPENRMPSFDDLLKKMDTNNDGVLSRAEASKEFEGFFDNLDANKDGKIVRAELDAIVKFMTEGASSAFALTPGGSGDVTGSHLLWKQTKGMPYIASAIVYRGQYVMVKDGGIVTAFDAKTGAEIYRGRHAADGKYYASPVAAGGNIYFTSLEGAVTVLKAGTQKPEVVATDPKLDQRISATPAIADNTLYLRTDSNLWAFAQSK